MRLVFRVLAVLSAIALPAAAQTSAVPIQTTPLDPANMDRSVSACTDFYQFANRKWLGTTSIPDDRNSWGTFAIIDSRNEKLRGNGHW